MWRLDPNEQHGKNEQPKIHITSTFPVFDYTAHPNLCGDTVVLSGVKLAAGIHECLSELFYFMEPGQVRSINLHVLANMFDL